MAARTSEDALRPIIYAPQSCGVIDLRMEQTRTTRIRDTFEKVSAHDREADAHIAALFLQAGQFPASDGFRDKTCPSCTACIPVRVPLAHFSENAEHRRIRRHNQHLDVEFFAGLPDMTDGYNDSELARLYANYRAVRFHKDAFDDAFSYLQGLYNYTGMDAHSVTARDPHTGELAGCAVFHTAHTAAYGTVHFYRTELRAQGIGHFLMLSGIAAMKDMGIKHLYLGHWTREPSAYSWKAKYAPLEARVKGQWLPIDRDDIRALRASGRAAYPAPRALPSMS